MIIVCEPECLNNAHEEVNSAFIAGLTGAYPGEKIVFFAEEGQIKSIRNALTRNGIDISKIDFRVSKIPPHPLDNGRKFFEYVKFFKPVFKFAKDNDVTKFFLLSVNSYNLYAVKYLKIFYKNIKFAITIHGILETIKIKPNWKKIVKFWELIFMFRYPLQFGKNKNIRYIVLSPSIKENACAVLPKMSDFIQSVHHPYIFKVVKEYSPFKNKVITFGTTGALFESKGAFVFADMVSDLNKLFGKEKVKFIAIGRLDKKEDFPENLYVPAENRRLEREEMSKYAEDVDYFLFFYPMDSYQYMASGAFFDCFSYGKPVVALKNTFIEYYFKMLGNIGFLCENYEDMKEKLSELIKNQSVGLYNEQKNNIISGRKKIGIKHLESELKNVFE